MNYINKINWRFWVGIIISAIFIGILLYRVQFEEVILTIRQANYLFVTPAIGIYFVSILFRALRWHYILRPIERVPIATLFIVVIIGYTANNLLPARLGEIVRAYYLARKTSVRDSTSLATIAVERVYDGITLLVFGAIAITLLVGEGMFKFIENFYQSKIFFLGVGGLIIFSLALAFVIFSGSASIQNFLKFLIRIAPVRMQPILHRNVEWFMEGLAVADSPRRHIGIFLWSCPVWLLESFMYLLVAYSFHINHQFESLNALIWVMVLLNSTSNLATAIPSTIGGIGPFEIAAQQTLLVFDVSPSIGAIYAAFLHLVALWLPITLIGLLILWHQNWSLKTPPLNLSATKPDHDMEQ